ncbi:hypothetical protein [Aeromicrobium ginsengisoli]|uniref:Uncharacterized protein n=1 Tax=Aeromicrobium ginsengisoli TaxID=363867 RepID=A0A5M4FF94_9ACTN|nr:hypothetical protein [Aeromicrobium ginsengisoli]KAA1397889.1 hypothetical protein ESP70_011145 [Aeromicrobium ginsengisoli]
MGLFNRTSRRVTTAAFWETQYLVDAGDETDFYVQIEPEGMVYEFPPHEKVLLTFRQRPDRTQYVELSHHKDALIIWRSSDAEVWATTADGTIEQIGGFSSNPAPWLDSGHTAAGPPPWSWPPSPGEG